jgi:hypothetical protein
MGSRPRINPQTNHTHRTEIRNGSITAPHRTAPHRNNRLKKLTRPRLYSYIHLIPVDNSTWEKIKLMRFASSPSAGSRPDGHGLDAISTYLSYVPSQARGVAK